jgi:hypothetical protein
MKLTGTKIVEEPLTVISQDVVVTGVAPSNPRRLRPGVCRAGAQPVTAAGSGRFAAASGAGRRRLEYSDDEHDEDGRAVPDVRGHRGARVEAAPPRLRRRRQPAPCRSRPRWVAVYPGSGQDAAKQGKDESECYTWARQQTGIDPTVATAAAPVEAPKGGAVKGAARGAARGAAVGAVGDDDRQRDDGNLDAGEGASAGAAAGAVKGRRAQKKAGKQAEAQAKQTAQAQDATSKDTFKKAWGACLEGRGYSVK